MGYTKDATLTKKPEAIITKYDKGILWLKGDYENNPFFIWWFEKLVLYLQYGK